MQTHELDKSRTNPGIHKYFRIDNFSAEEQKILHRLSSEWYLTNSGEEFQLGASRFRFFLMKPTNHFSEMFNLEREIVAVFSPYENFEPRTLDAFDFAVGRLASLRPESVCRVLISRDKAVERKITDLLKSDPEQPIVIPFTYDDLLSSYDDYFLRNRFRKHFFTRDLFSFLSPLKKDLYFFGRSELIQDIVNRHYSGEHNALFGLRKSGKTSIIFAVERFMAAHEGLTLTIDCENPSVHKLRWNELLGYIVETYKEKYALKCKTSAPQKYSDEKKASSLFEADILRIFSEVGKSTLLIFDEIERISPTTGSSSHWREGDDFVYFWQTLRYFYQKHTGVFTYMLVGTNPSCVEKPNFGIHDNPLFSSIPFRYVPNFNYDQVREMVRKLGKYMGLKFDEPVYARLQEDFGGHPFLVRQMCSMIHSICTGERPETVSKVVYEKAKKKFLLESKHYVEMIIQVLRDWYPDEYDMLRFLANGDLDDFDKFARESNYYTSHLVGYGLISVDHNSYAFNIECVKEYLQDRYRYERRTLTPEQRLSEISARRNELEQRLRKLLRNQLKASHGPKQATTIVLGALPSDRQKKLVGEDVDSLLSPDSGQLYFNELITILEKEWKVFQYIFHSIEKDELIYILKEINKLRNDAHAKSMTEDDFTQIRLHFKRLETILTDWL